MRPYRDDNTECPNCRYPGGGLIVVWVSNEDVEMNGCNRCGYRWPSSDTTTAGREEGT